MGCVGQAGEQYVGGGWWWGGGSSEGVGCTWWRWGGRDGAGIEGEHNTGRDQLSKTSAIRPADNRKGRGRGGGMVKRREREGGQKGSSFTPSMFCPPFPPNSFSCSTHLYTPILSAPNTLLRFVYHHLQTSYQHGPVISICLHTLPQAHYIQYYVHFFPALFFTNPLLPSLPSPSIPPFITFHFSTTSLNLSLKQI